MFSPTQAKIEEVEKLIAEVNRMNEELKLVEAQNHKILGTTPYTGPERRKDQLQK